MSHYRPKAAEGEICTMCGEDAYHKVGEEFLDDEINELTYLRHPMTAYICCVCFRKTFKLQGCS